MEINSGETVLVMGRVSAQESNENSNVSVTRDTSIMALDAKHKNKLLL